MSGRDAFIKEFEKIWPTWGEFIEESVYKVETGLYDIIKNPHYMITREKSKIIGEIYTGKIKSRYCWDMPVKRD